MSSTSAVDVSIHAVSPLSIFDAGAGAGAPAAGAPGAAGAAVPAGAAGCWAMATATVIVPPSTSIIASARLNRFTRDLLMFAVGAPPPPTVGGSSQRGLVSLAGTDPNRGFHRSDEDLAVADVAGLRGRRRRVGDLLHEVIRHDDL